MGKPLLIALVLLGLAGPVWAGESATSTAWSTGTASWYGPGNGAAMPFCTWAYRHAHGCGSMVVNSLDTGITVIVPIIDYCQCYIGTPQERIIDLQWGVVTALGLDLSRGLYQVKIVPFLGVLPDAAMQTPKTQRIAPHWLEE